MNEELVADFLKQNRLLSTDAINILMGWEEKTRAVYLSRGMGPEAIRVGRQIFYPYDSVTAYITGEGTPALNQRAVAASLLKGGKK